MSEIERSRLALGADADHAHRPVQHQFARQHEAVVLQPQIVQLAYHGNSPSLLGTYPATSGTEPRGTRSFIRSLRTSFVSDKSNYRDRIVGELQEPRGRAGEAKVKGK